MNLMYYYQLMHPSTLSIHFSDFSMYGYLCRHGDYGKKAMLWSWWIHPWEISAREVRCWESYTLDCCAFKKMHLIDQQCLRLFSCWVAILQLSTCQNNLRLYGGNPQLSLQSVRIHAQFSTQFLHLMTSLCLSLNQDKETVPSVCSCARINYFEEEKELHLRVWRNELQFYSIWKYLI